MRGIDLEHAVKPPFVVAEVGDPELIFFLELDELLEDRFDVLWDDRYEVWDSEGMRFELRRVERSPNWIERILRVDTSELRIEQVPLVQDTEAIGARVLSWAVEVLKIPATQTDLAALSFPDLLQLCARAELELGQRTAVIGHAARRSGE